MAVASSGAISANRAGYLQSVAQTDVDFTTEVSLDTASTGGGAYVSLIGRRVSNNNDYRLKLRYLAGGSVAAYLVNTVGGTETILASTTISGLTVAPGDVLQARFVAERFADHDASGRRCGARAQPNRLRGC